MSSVTFKLDGDLERVLKELSGGKQRRILKPAARRAIKPVAASAKAGVPKETGALRRAITTNVKSKRDGTIDARIGIRKDVVVPMPQTRRAYPTSGVPQARRARTARKRNRVRRPYRYAMFVERGTKFARAVHFMERAWTAHLAGVQRVFNEQAWVELKKLIERERAKATK